MKAVEDLQQKCEGLEEENSKLKYQLYVKELYDPKVVDQTIKAIATNNKKNEEIEILKQVHDQE